MQALTGPQLLLIDNKTLVDFGIEQESRIQTILKAVEQLRSEVNNQPKDFYEFKVSCTCMVISIHTHAMFEQ